MPRLFRITCTLIAFLLVCMQESVFARPSHPTHAWTETEIDVDIVGDRSGKATTPRTVQQDTVWIATWTFETGAVCDFSGWEKVDNHILNDGQVFWDIDATFGGTGNIAGAAAALGYEGDFCCEDANGYRNDWHQAIRIEYSGAANISFDYVVDSENNFDFLHVEEDSACASFDRVDFDVDPSANATTFRNLTFSVSGFTSGTLSALGLTDFGAGTHCVYIAFFSDTPFSPCDGLWPTTLGKALVIDNIAIQDAGGTRTEDFEDMSLDIGTFVNIQDSSPFGPTAPGRDGSWARVFEHVTDNDLCIENTTCAVLWTDDTTPTIANDPSMAFGPGGYVVRNWLDDIIVSPWVDLSTTPTAARTIVQFRRFPGNFFSTSRLVQNWSIRGKLDVDDGMGGTFECVTQWGHAFQWNSLSIFAWIAPSAFTRNAGYDASADFDPSSKAVQIRHRTSDWQWIVGAPPPAVFAPGPGPYIDRTRIGRTILTGPAMDEGIDARDQAQDGFPTEIHPLMTSDTGEHFRPTTDRFGTAAFSAGLDRVNRGGPNLAAGDSVSMEVQDVRGAGGIVRIEVHGAIVAGPHAGMAPPPHSVGANGFFVVAADSARQFGTVVEGHWLVDLDDFYFVGSDVLHYFWLAEDALGGFSSDPVGLSGVPASVAEAQSATGGMFEVSFLPTIAWDADYLAAVAANNKVDPQSDPTYLDESSQRNCILYVNRVNSRRRSGDLNRTSFMYTLDSIGYRDAYDVYDHSGMGSTNNQLGGRATIEQAQGYNLIVYDAGNVGPGGTIMPTGMCPESEKVDQAGWFRGWLAQAPMSEAGFATLWILGSNVLEERPTNALYTVDMGTTLTATDQGLNVNPNVVGQASFAFDVGATTNSVDFTLGEKAEYTLNGGCPTVRNYDAQAAGSGTTVYRFADPVTGGLGDAAVVMHSNPSGNANTIMMSHPWFDIREDFGEAPVSLTSSQDLAADILAATLPTSCVVQFEPVDTPDHDELRAPARSALHQNAPNPFNPATTIRFEIARRGLVQLRVYDVAGRWVRTLVEGVLEAQRHDVVWDGLDAHGTPVASGVYAYRLEIAGFSATRKMVVLR